jgi:hypothetical protein
LKKFAILLNIFAGIPFGESEIEDFGGIDGADPTMSGAETVD